MIKRCFLLWQYNNDDHHNDNDDNEDLIMMLKSTKYIFVTKVSHCSRIQG